MNIHKLHPKLWRISSAVVDTSDNRYQPDRGQGVTDNVKAFRDKYRSHKLEALMRSQSTK